jgi:hypothetical protein
MPFCLILSLFKFLTHISCFLSAVNKIILKLFLLYWKFLTLRYSVVQKVDVSRYRYSTNTILADANLAIGSRWPSQNQTVDVNWQKFPADGKSGS